MKGIVATTGRRRPPVSGYALPLVLGVATLAVVYGRFVVQAHDAVRAARVSARAGDSAEATRYYLDALRAYVPGSPFQRQALDGLAQLAASARAAGDASEERRAWEAMRVGLLSTRSFYTPDRSRFDEANHRLAELDGEARFPPADLENVWARARGLGAGRSGGLPAGASPGPAVAATLVALIGLAIWVGAIVLLIRRGVERSPRRRPAALSFAELILPALFVLGFALFLVGLRFT